MAEKKHSLLIYTDSPLYEAMDDGELGRFIRAQMAYQETGEIVLDKGDELYFALLSVVGIIDANNEKYLRRCENGKEAALKRWESKQPPMPEDANPCQPMPAHANNADTDTDTDTDKGIDKKKDKKEICVFKPPSISEVRNFALEYSAEKNIPPLDAEGFIDYFSAQGWKLSNGNRMKDWKAAARQWMRRDGGMNDGKHEAFDAWAENMQVLRQ